MRIEPHTPRREFGPDWASKGIWRAGILASLVILATTLARLSREPDVPWWLVAVQAVVQMLIVLRLYCGDAQAFRLEWSLRSRSARACQEETILSGGLLVFQSFLLMLSAASPGTAPNFLAFVTATLGVNVAWLVLRARRNLRLLRRIQTRPCALQDIDPLLFLTQVMQFWALNNLLFLFGCLGILAIGGPTMLWLCYPLAIASSATDFFGTWELYTRRL